MLSESTKQYIEASGGGTITNLADDEDLESVNDVLKFKDKAYDADNFSGLGRKYLRKNIVEGKNVLTQDMINEVNTIYIIQYDYDLNGEEIVIPENCTLQFEGGSLKNGSLSGECEVINYSDLSSFMENVDITSFKIKDKDLFIVDNKRWGISNNETNSYETTKGINAAFEYAYKIGYKKVKLTEGTYLVEIREDGFYDSKFKECITLQSNIEYDFTGVTFKQRPHNNESSHLLFIFGKENISIKNAILIGDRLTHDYSSGGTHEGCAGLGVWASNNISINNLNISDFPGDAIFVAGSGSVNFEGNGSFNPNMGSKFTKIINCELSHCRRQGISVVNAFDTLIKNCNIHDIGLDEENGTPPQAAIDLEPWNETFIAELVLRTKIINCIFENNWRHIIVSNPYVYDTVIDSCSFISKEPEEEPIYANDLVCGVQDTGATTPRLTQSYQNKYPVDIYWKYGNTIIKNCNFRNSYVSAAFYTKNCIFYGAYSSYLASIGESEDFYLNIKGCKFYGKFIGGGSLETKIDNCYFEHLKKIHPNYTLIDCTIEDCDALITKATYNTTINRCHRTIGGILYNCNITFEGTQSSDGVSYFDATYISCQLTFVENISLKTGFNYYLKLLNNIININSGYKVVGSSKQAIIQGNTININHDNSAYINPYFSNNDLISTNNLVINQIQRTSSAATFGSTGIIKNNVYIGDNLTDENL